MEPRDDTSRPTDRRIRAEHRPPRHGLLAALIGLTALVAGCDQELQPLMGMPLHGLTSEEEQLFAAGRTLFAKHFEVGEGLGPLFNDFGCGDCHNSPAMGGFNQRTNTRFGRRGEVFDPLLELGGTVFQFQTTSPSCEEFLPPEADVFADRGTTALFGLGLVEAIPDEDLVALERSGLPSAGRVHWVLPLEGDSLRAGRFGWKSQIATILSFSADASLEEMGITNRLLKVENAPNGDRERLARGDTVADPEDRPDHEGYEFIDRFTHFQQFLAPPPQTPRSGMRGERIFAEVGCAECHVPSFTTGPHASRALSRVELRPYSDFLLHDMGSLGDGIIEGAATERMMRTAPLWGLSSRTAFLHDYQSTGGDFAENLRSAIARHEGQGAPSRDRFGELEPERQELLIAFLGSLGRAEFDSDGDNDVDGDDVLAFIEAWKRGGPISPDQPEAIFDFDADGALGLSDWAGLARALEQSANMVREKR